MSAVTRKHNPKKNGGNNRLSLVLIAGAALVVCIFIAVRVLVSRYDGDSAAMLYIPHGISDDALADSLDSRLGDSFGGRVATLVGGADGAHPGAYAVEPGMSAWRVARNITHGYQTPVRLSFNNVIDITELSERISSRMEFKSDEFMSAVDSSLIGNGYDKENVLAGFTPDTYEFYWTDTPDKVVERLHGQTLKVWNDKRKRQADKIGLTPVEVVILASIVEEESAKRDEYGKIARLYLNRLDRGMRLQADPTVKRAVGDRSLRRIKGKHLRVKSPYNTYLYKGLIPGPLHLPEVSTLDAVLTAPEHNYLFMCASPDFSGYHVFAADYDAHKANAARYQAALDARGIK